MINREEYLQYIGNIQRIKDAVFYIYERVQELSLEILGYSWGPANKLVPIAHCKDTYINCGGIWEPSESQKEIITVNNFRGGEMRFPAKWLSDAKWEDKARRILFKAREKAMIEALEKDYNNTDDPF